MLTTTQNTSATAW